MTYSRSDGAPGLALLGSVLHLQPDMAEPAETASVTRARHSATDDSRYTRLV
jgi:hypothetical protein